MESIKDNLTNEKLKARFLSQFDLVNYAIKLAENMIATGRAPRVRSNMDNNVALQILQEIVAGKDKFQEVTKRSDNYDNVPPNARDRLLNPEAHTERLMTRK